MDHSSSVRGSVDFPGGTGVKNLPANAEDTGEAIPGLERSLGWKDPLEEEMVTHSFLGSPMDRGAWWATVHGVPESWR